MKREFSDSFIPRSNLVSREYISYCKIQIEKLSLDLDKINCREYIKGLSEEEEEEKAELEKEISYYNSQISQVKGAIYQVMDLFLVDREEAKKICSPSTYEQVRTMFQLNPQGPSKRIYIDFDSRYNVSGRFPDDEEKEV
jgi:hypothetical protein